VVKISQNLHLHHFRVQGFLVYLFFKTLAVKKCLNHKFLPGFYYSKNKFHRTVSFSKDSQEQVKIRPSAENKSTSHLAGISSVGGRRLQNHTGGCNRQQDVKLELQMNKVQKKYTL